MKHNLFFFLLLLVTLFSCSEEEITAPDMQNEVVGYWINPQYEDTIYSYDRASELKDGDYGFAIQTNGEFLERANSGWCGTPPIAYADYNGTWNYRDSILDITVAFWGGTAHYKWKVLSVDEEKLSFSKLETEYEYVDDRAR